MKRIVIILITGALYVLSAGIKAGVNYSCSVYDGFYFENETQSVLGHLTYMKLSTGTVLSNDLYVKDPTLYPQDVSVAGVMIGTYWDGGLDDPIYMSFLVSAFNKNLVSQLLNTQITNTEVEFNFNIYDYDITAKTYFKAFSPLNSVILLGLINESGGNLEILVEDSPSTEINQPQVYRMEIGIKPRDISQQLLIALSTTQDLIKLWGLSTSPPEPPSLNSPDNVSSVNDLTPTFWWGYSEGALSYTIMVDNNSDFGTPEINITTNFNEFTPASDLASGTYFWKVSASNLMGTSDYSSTWSVTLNAPPPPPPGGIMIEQNLPGLILQWNDVEGATGYDVYSSDDPYGTFNFEISVTISEYEINSVNSKKFYYIVAKN